METWLWLGLLVLLGVVTALLVMVSVRWGQRGKRGTRGARGRRGPSGPNGLNGVTGPSGANGIGATGSQGVTGPNGVGATGPTGTSVGAISLIPYGAGQTSRLGVGNGSIAMISIGRDWGDLPVVVDPTESDQIVTLNSFSWAANAPALLRDLQVVFPPGFGSTGSMQLVGQVYKQDACNGPWTGTPLVATQELVDTGATGWCFSNNSDTVSLVAGDRVALVLSTTPDSVFWLASLPGDGISASLGYQRT